MDSGFDRYNNTVQSIDDFQFNALFGNGQEIAGNRLSSSLFFVRLVVPRATTIQPRVESFSICDDRSIEA